MRKKLAKLGERHDNTSMDKEIEEKIKAGEYIEFTPPSKEKGVSVVLPGETEAALKYIANDIERKLAEKYPPAKAV